MSDAVDAAPGYFRDCDECGEEVGGHDAIEHPSHDAVFCSRRCKHRWENSLEASLR